MDLQRNISILAGYNFWQNHYGEVGISLNQYGIVGYHPAAWACFISSEIKIDDELVIGPKIGAWMGGGVAGMALGFNIIYYTDLEESSLRIRPEIGLGFDRWKVVYGYNIAITNKNFEGINTNNIGLAFMFGVKKLKTIQL